MKRVTIGVVAVAASICALIEAAPRVQDKTARIPVVVELFTSEGCSSCPPADLLLAKLVADQPVAGAEIVALGQHVDYWDKLGWTDPFSAPEFTARQAEYRRRLALDALFTPQIVVDGRESLVGSDGGAVRKAISKAIRAPKATLQLAVSIPDRVVIAARAAGLQRAGLRQHASLVIAITEEGLTSHVERGENQGRRLSHAAVVRVIGPVLDIDPRADTANADVPVVLEPTWNRDKLNVVAFVQEQESGRILCAAIAPLR